MALTLTRCRPVSLGTSIHRSVAAVTEATLLPACAVSPHSGVTVTTQSQGVAATQQDSAGRPRG